MVSENAFSMGAASAFSLEGFFTASEASPRNSAWLVTGDLQKSARAGSLLSFTSFSRISDTSFALSSWYFAGASCRFPMQFLLEWRLKENMQSWQLERLCE